MRIRFSARTWGWLAGVGLAVIRWPVAESSAGSVHLRIASYNVENYLIAPAATRAAKDPVSRARVREAIRGLQAQVVALQEMGGAEALLELRAGLEADGLAYPYWELLRAHDTNIELAVLSQLPILARRPHAREFFLLHGRRFMVSRGILELEIQAAPAERFILFAAHLKSKRLVPEGDEAEIREEEARRLRRWVDQRLRENPRANIVVLGDFNDTRDSATLRLLRGRGRNSLIDTRPAEADRTAPDEAHPAQAVAWTHYFFKEDSYSRIDYILISRSLAHYWTRSGTFVLALPDWRAASDHRPIVAEFSVPR